MHLFPLTAVSINKSLSSSPHGTSFAAYAFPYFVCFETLPPKDLASRHGKVNLQNLLPLRHNVFVEYVRSIPGPIAV